MTALTDEYGQPITDEFDQALFSEVAQLVPALTLAPSRIVVASAADMARQLSNHGPSGDAWPEDPDSVYQQQLLALAPTFSRLNDRANYLVEDMFPGTTVEILPEWEASLGLPDPCTGPLPTIALRQAAVKAALAARGGQSVPYLTGVAARLNQAVTIKEFTPSRFGRPFGLPFGGEDWAYTWRIVAPQTVISPFQFGVGRFGDPFRTFGSMSLQCTFGRIKPAHTILQVAYSGADPANPPPFAFDTPGAGWDQGVLTA